MRRNAGVACGVICFRKGQELPYKVLPFNLNLFHAKRYGHPTGDAFLRKRRYLPSFTLNLPHFPAVTQVTPHVYYETPLFGGSYVVKECPENPHNTYLNKNFKRPIKSVKTRRKPLAGNDVFLQMAIMSLRGPTGTFIEVAAPPKQSHP